MAGRAGTFSASHQTDLTQNQMTRRSIIVGIREEEGRSQAEAQALLDYAGHRSTLWAWGAELDRDQNQGPGM